MRFATAAPVYFEDAPFVMARLEGGDRVCPFDVLSRDVMAHGREQPNRSARMAYVHATIREGCL